MKKQINVFFLLMLEELSKQPYSQESGRRIFEPSKLNICHIFPKRKYWSVAESKLNIVFLTWEEHTRFDYLIDTMQFDKIVAEFPNVWEIIKIRLPLILNIIEEKGRLLTNILEYLQYEKK